MSGTGYDLRRRERIEWTNSWIEDARDSSGPRILLVGDSCTRKLRKSVKRLMPAWNCDVLATSYSVDDPHFSQFVDSFLQDADYRYRLIILQVNHHGSVLASSPAGRAVLHNAYLALTDQARARSQHVVWVAASACHRKDRCKEVDEEADAELRARNELVRVLCNEKGVPFVDFYRHAVDAGYAYEDEYHFRWSRSWRESARFIIDACVRFGAIGNSDVTCGCWASARFFEKTRRLGRTTYWIFGMPAFSFRRPMVAVRHNAAGGLPGKTVLRIDVGAQDGRPRDGLFALANHALAWMAYADRRGMVPVVDMMAHPTIYQPSCEGTDPWECFFDQPGDVSLSEAMTASRVATTVRRMDGDEMPGVGMDFFNDSQGALTKWRQLARRFLRPSARVIALASDYERESHIDYETTIGVLARGTDYLKLRPSGHPVQPDPAAVISDVRELMAKGPYRQVFLVTEDPGVKAQFQEALGDRLLLAPQKSVSYTGGYLAESAVVANNIEMGVAYLVSVLLLSRCRAIVAGRTSGSVAAAYLSSGFAYQKFYDLGEYGRQE